jgi:hypothetical protein
VEALGIFLRLMRRVPDREPRRIYCQRLWKMLKRRRSPVVMQIYAIKCAVHYHAHVMIAQMQSGQIVNSF